MKTKIDFMIDYIKKHTTKIRQAKKDQLDLWNGIIPRKQPLLLNCELDDLQKKTYPVFTPKEIHYNSEKMLFNGLVDAMTAVNGKCESVPSVRSNMGCGIFPSLFGLEQQLFDDKMPWVREHLSKETLKKIGPEDLKIGKEFKAGLEHMVYMADRIKDTECMIYPMDLQGAMDTAHLVYGDQIFYDLFDDPEFVHHILELSTQAVILGIEECLKVIPYTDDMIAHYNTVVIPRCMGGIKISEDTSTLLSKDHIEEFVAPYIHKILEHFKGGYIHYCGTNPHLLHTVLNEPLAYGLNFGNPGMHDMEDVLKKCVAKNMLYYGPIDKKTNESLEEFFSKYYNASASCDRNLLLLKHNCTISERDSIIETWNKVTKA